MADNGLFGNIYNPDVLSCLANLSSDEVFTPPNIVNEMLDMLPKELFENPNTTFLDPACKSGVFLREIAKRLIKGLEKQIPDLQNRLDHIYKNQLYGIAITELTSLLSRRSVYCSKYPNSEFSVTKFDNEHAQGNIRFKRIEHVWQDGRCVFCGATQSEYDRDKSLETHAYELIHTINPEEIFNMKFDVIIGNPPYQLSDGGAQASAKPIYHLFIEQAKKLKPRFLSMIIPARWYAGGKGLDIFRNEFLNDNHVRIMHDFIKASDCFTGVEIKGGVCYFLWDRDYTGNCSINSHVGNKIVSSMERPLLEKDNDTFIRYNDAISILRKVKQVGELTFDSIVSARKPFGLPTNFKDYQKKADEVNNILVYAQKEKGYVNINQIIKNKEFIKMWKIFVPEAIGIGNMALDVVKPIIGSPNTICTETYVMIGPFDNEIKAQKIQDYINTKFFHFLLGLKKITQHTTSKTYSFIPLIDLTEEINDEYFYNKYKLTKNEIEFIEKSVWNDKDGESNE